MPLNSSAEILKILAQVAGVGGIGLGLVLIIFRDTLRKAIFPQLDKRRAFHLLVLIVVLTTLVGLAGLAAWVFFESR